MPHALRRAALFAVLLAAAGLAAPGDDEGPDPSGDWTIVTGEGLFHIEKAPRGVKHYLLRWTVGGKETTGFGLVREGRLHVAWGAGAMNAMAWRLQGKEWKTAWLRKGHVEDRVGEDTVRGEALAGEHVVYTKGPEPRPRSFKAALTVEKAGNLYKMTWTYGDNPPTTGIGFEVAEGRLVAAIGDGKEEFGCAVYDLAGGADKIEGRRVGWRDDAIRVERLERKKK